MNNLIEMPSSEVIHAIGWTIIHSLWQSSLIALVVAVIYVFTKKASATTRYWINALGLLSCVIASTVTFFSIFSNKIVIDIISSNPFDNSIAITQNYYAHNYYKEGWLEIFNKNIDEIVFFWLIGFSFYTIKYLKDFLACQRVKNYKNSATSEQWLRRFNELKNCLGITESIQLRVSELVDVPCVIGHFKPMILLPASVMLGLSTKQIEVILLHELSHIRRNDYLIKNLQTFTTSIYFFNPFIHWISSKMDEERENACDDMAVSVNGDPLFYANTLKEFAEMKESYVMAVAITDSKNLLLNRIKRLFSNEASHSKIHRKPITIMVFFLFMAGYSLTGFSDGGKNEAKHNFKVEKVTLSEAISLAEQSCPDEINLIKLKNPYRIVTADLQNISCGKLAEFITRTDKVFKEKTFKSDFRNENIDTILSQLSDECPGIAERINIKRPNHLKINFVSESATCELAQSHIENQYLAATTLTDDSTIVNNGFGTEPYTKAIWPNMAVPTGLKVNADVTCNSGFSVNKQGKSFDIISKCNSNSQEAALTFEKILIAAINKTQFKPKIVNGKTMNMTNIRFSNNFSVDEKYGVL